MKTSVVMATYNGADYIIEQLESIRMQTVPPDEVIICDDQSKDDTVCIVRQYILKNNLSSKWKIIINETNLGYGENFRLAAELASGDYILFADQDDIWKHEKIETMVTIMEHRPDCMLLNTDYEPFSDEGYYFRIPEYVHKKMPDNSRLQHLEFQDQTLFIGALGCCMCVRKDFRDAIAPYYFSGWAHDDRYWRLALCAGGNYILHSNLTRHRIHDHNTATYGKYHTKEKRLKNYKDVQKACEVMMQYLIDMNASEKQVLLVRKHLRMMKLRIDLIENKHFWDAIPLIGFLPHYLAKKSWLVDLYVMIFG